MEFEYAVRFFININEEIHNASHIGFAGMDAKHSIQLTNITKTTDRNKTTSYASVIKRQLFNVDVLHYMMLLAGISHAFRRDDKEELFNL